MLSDHYPSSSSSSIIEELSIERIIDERVKKKDGMNEYLNHFGKKIRKQKLNHGLLLVHVGEGKVRPVIPKSYDQISSRGTANECGT